MSFLGPLGSFISSLTWAVGSTTYSHLSRKYPPSVVNFNRAIIALPLYLVGILILFGTQEFGPKLTEPSRSQMGWLAVSQISSFALGDVLFLLAAQRVGVSMSLTIASIYPIWSALAGLTLRGEQIRLHQWLGLFTVIVGVILMIRVTHKSGEVSKSQNPRLGIFLAFGTSLMWAFNTYGVSAGASGLHPMIANAYRMFFALPLCWVFGVGMGVRGPWLLKMADYRSYGWIFAIEAFLGSLCFTYGLAHSPLAVAAALSSLSPLLAVPIAILWGDETLNMKKAGLILLVTLGIVALVI